MAGLEILGIAASVIQVADTGMRLSVKLFSFTRKVKRANKDIEALSHEIAITGAALQELGGTLSDKQTRQLCSPQALSTAGQLITDCNSVFDQLEAVVDPKSDGKNKSGKLPIGQRLNHVFLESRIKELQVNMERLKSSILVILNVLIFAQQLRTHEEVSILKDQRQLIQTLVDEHKAAEQRYNESLKLLTFAQQSETLPSYTSTTGENDSIKLRTSLARTSSVQLPSRLELDRSRIVDHGRLVDKLLKEISSNQYDVGLRHRSNLQDGILDIHWQDWDDMRQTYGSRVFLQLYDDFDDIARHWTDKARQDGAPIESIQKVVDSAPLTQGRSYKRKRRAYDADEEEYEDHFLRENSEAFNFRDDSFSGPEPPVSSDTEQAFLEGRIDVPSEELRELEDPLVERLRKPEEYVPSQPLQRKSPVFSTIHNGASPLVKATGIQDTVKTGELFIDGRLVHRHNEKEPAAVSGTGVSPTVDEEESHRPNDNEQDGKTNADFSGLFGDTESPLRYDYSKFHEESDEDMGFGLFDDAPPPQARQDRSSLDQEAERRTEFRPDPSTAASMGTSSLTPAFHDNRDVVEALDSTVGLLLAYSTLTRSEISELTSGLL